MASRYTELKNAHEARLSGQRPDCTAHSGKDFHDTLAELASCKGKSREEKFKVFNTVLQDSDFSETHDLDISVPGGFWDKIVRRSESLANVASIPTASHVISSNELTLGSAGEDVWRPGVEGTDPSDTGTLDTAQRTFTPEEVIAIFGITDTVLEDNIEHGSLESHIMRMVEDTAANEWAKAIWGATKVGTTNSARGSITACFDGFIQQINDGGNIVYATSYEDRYLSSIQENDKLLAAVKAFPTKYSKSGLNWMTTYGLMLDWNAELGQRQTQYGDQRIQAQTINGIPAEGFPMYDVPALRTNYLVKATGVVMATTPVDTTITAIAKSRQKDYVLAAADNTGNDLVLVLGCDAAGTSFDLNSEVTIEDGSISTLTITAHTNLVRDHASGEICTEYSTTPTVTGIPTVLTDWANLGVYYQRVMKIEPYRQPRTRKTDFVLSARFVPIVFNPDRAVLVRDLAVRA